MAWKPRLTESRTPEERVEYLRSIAERRARVKARAAVRVAWRTRRRSTREAPPPPPPPKAPPKPREKVCECGRTFTGAECASCVDLDIQAGLRRARRRR